MSSRPPSAAKTRRPSSRANAHRNTGAQPRLSSESAMTDVLFAAAVFPGTHRVRNSTTTDR